MTSKDKADRIFIPGRYGNVCVWVSVSVCVCMRVCVMEREKEIENYKLTPRTMSQTTRKKELTNIMEDKFGKYQYVSLHIFILIFLVYIKVKNADSIGYSV